MLKSQNNGGELGLAFKQSKGKGHVLHQNSLSLSGWDIHLPKQDREDNRAPPFA